jgi:type IV secretion system protein VirB5
MVNQPAQKIDYEAVKHEWNALFTRPVKDKERWMVIAAGEFVIVILLLVGFISVSLKSQIVPWVVEVDQLGRAVAIGPAKQVEALDERIIKAFLYRFIELSRSVITDPQAMRENLKEVYEMAGPKAETLLNEYYRQHNPMELARSRSVQILPVSFLKESEDTYLVEWKEIHRDLNSKILEERRWKALLIITKTSPSIHDINSNPNNPFGIGVESLSWSETS